MEVRELLSKYEFPGDAIPIIKGSAKMALEGDKGELGEQSIFKLAEALDSYIPTPERAMTSRSDADRGRVLDFWPWHGGHGAGGARRGPGGRGDRDRRHSADG